MKKGIVAIGGVGHTVGSTVNGFKVLEPCAAYLDTKCLKLALLANEQTIQRTFGEKVYNAMLKFCTDCLVHGLVQAEVTVVANKSANGRTSYICDCSCGEDVQQFTLLENFLTFDPQTSTSSSREVAARSAGGARQVYA